MVCQLIEGVGQRGLEFHGFLIRLGNHLGFRDLRDSVNNEG